MIVILSRNAFLLIVLNAFKAPPAKLLLTTDLHIFYALRVEAIHTQLLALHRLVTNQLLILYLPECVIQPPY